MFDKNRGNSLGVGWNPSSFSLNTVFLERFSFLNLENTGNINNIHNLEGRNFQSLGRNLYEGENLDIFPMFILCQRKNFPLPLMSFESVLRQAQVIYLKSNL